MANYKIKFKYVFIIYIIFLLTYHCFQRNKKKENQITNYNSYKVSILKKLKKVVYSALLGNYDTIRPILKEDGYDYFLFTDQIMKNESNSNWTILYIDDQIKNLNLSIIKKQRYFKMHPHLFFKNYDISIYIDTTFIIKGKLDEFLLRILSPNLSIYVLEHPDRNSVNNEFSAVLIAHKDSNTSVISVQKKYNNENFPDNNGLSENCLIVRKHNELSCINFMNDWFDEIKYNSHRDQLSFNYILWKYENKNVKYISKRYIEDYFIQEPEHLIIVQFKNN